VGVGKLKAHVPVVHLEGADLIVLHNAPGERRCLFRHNEVDLRIVPQLRQRELHKAVPVRGHDGRIVGGYLEVHPHHGGAQCILANSEGGFADGLAQ